MSEPVPPSGTLPLSAERRVDALCLSFEAARKGGQQPRIEEYLGLLPAGEQAAGLRELLRLELAYRRQGGERPAVEDYRLRFPGHLGLLDDVFASPAAGAGLPSVPGYQIEGLLGRGGMGVVYRARQVALNRPCALKMILTGGHAGADDRVRFLAEAEAIAKVKHPGIVQVYDSGTHDGLPYFSLELCAGGSLAGKLRDGPLQAQDAARLVGQVAESVHAAHQAGIVHRDLKPGNVLLTADGTPKVTDFGLAKRTEGGGTTQTGAVMGTPAYMAPEQAQGRKDVGPAADVWALGAILYECLSARPPFRAATSAETILQVIADEPVPLRRLNGAIPVDLETICHKCLQKEAGRRYASAAALADDLRRWQAGEPIAGRPAGRLERAVKWARRRPAAAALVGVSGAAALALALTTALALAALDGARRERRIRARAQVGRLSDATPAAVPAILAELETNRADVLPHLRRRLAEEAEVRKRMRLALALLPVEPEEVREDLLAWMLEAEDPAELLVVRDALNKHSPEPGAGLWRRLSDPDLNPARRLRLLAALAAFDPDGAGWQRVDEQALQPWLADNLLYLGTWTRALRPARRHLMGPLTRVFCTGAPEQRPAAANILADYAGDQPGTLVELIVVANDRQFAALWPALLRHREEALPLLRRELKRQPGPRADEAARLSLARRQAGAGLALLKFGQADLAWPLLVHSAYPDARSRLIHRMRPVGVEARLLVDRLTKEGNVTARRALILALGEYRERELPARARGRLVDTLLRWYREDPDPGVHGAIDWLLRHGHEGPAARPLDWGQRSGLAGIDRALRRRDPDGKRRWYVNGQGQTLAVVDARQPFWMGSPSREAGRYSRNEALHWRLIGRRYAIGTKPVTVAQFRDFLAAYPQVKKGYAEEVQEERKHFSPDEDGPIVHLTWYEAAQYCRWLSEQEGFPRHEMVYPCVKEIEACKDGKKKLRLPANHLARKGYRLPREAEWEFACRAGARTSRYYGSSVALLPRYAWYQGNSEDRAWPVGQKRPNDLGLFDMHGNVWTWCQEKFAPYPPGSPCRPAGDEEGERDVAERPGRVMRGAAYTDHPTDVRASYRSWDVASNREGHYGLRVARTCD
jgi:formylglycine-generating enzyme required for sulfatase activity